MKQIIFTLLALLTTFCFIRAEEVFDFSGSLPPGWKTTVDPKGYETTELARGTQLDASNTLTFPEVQNVSKVTINGSTNIDNYTIEVRIGEVSFGTKTLQQGNYQTWEFAGQTTTGQLQIIITKKTKKSVWIKKVTIDGTYDKSLTPEDNPFEGLEEEYEYEEPTIVVSHKSEGSKIKFAFIDNNIRVTCISGTKTEDYFGPLAGQGITFAATKPMKAIVVDGFVRKGFSAETSDGKLAYKSSMAMDLEEEQILAVTDINSKTLTLTCAKQLRCNKVYVYFDANPEIDIEVVEDIYSYADETQEQSAIDITFTSLEAEDLTESVGYPCTSLYFSNDEYDLDAWVFASSLGEPTILPLGTYPIAQQPEGSYTPNTVMASPGGVEDYDIQTYLITDFEYNESSANWSYNKVYYLVSGKLTVTEQDESVRMNVQAVTYNGSTVNATYVLPSVEPIDAVDNTAIGRQATKRLSNGRIIIERYGLLYNIDGQQIVRD